MERLVRVSVILLADAKYGTNLMGFNDELAWSCPRWLKESQLQRVVAQGLKEALLVLSLLVPMFLLQKTNKRKK